jgi:hypothetical protein
MSKTQFGQKIKQGFQKQSNKFFKKVFNIERDDYFFDLKLH